jgi:hypothetical protein
VTDPIGGCRTITAVAANSGWAPHTSSRPIHPHHAQQRNDARQIRDQTGLLPTIEVRTPVHHTGGAILPDRSAAPPTAAPAGITDDTINLAEIRKRITTPAWVRHPSRPDPRRRGPHPPNPVAPHHCHSCPPTSHPNAAASPATAATAATANHPLTTTTHPPRRSPNPRTPGTPPTPPKPLPP